VGKPKAKLPSGTWIEKSLYESKAYLALTGVAPQLLTLFLGKRQFEYQLRGGRKERVCVNRDAIQFSYLEAGKKYGITKPRFARGVDDLLAKGFLTVKHFGGGFQRDQSVYGLSDQWRFWRPGTVFERRPKENITRGFCRPKNSFSTHETVPIHSHETVPM
jgi:hypothetical protein